MSYCASHLLIVTLFVYSVFWFFTIATPTYSVDDPSSHTSSDPLSRCPATEDPEFPEEQVSGYFVEFDDDSFDV